MRLHPRLAVAAAALCAGGAILTYVFTSGVAPVERAPVPFSSVASAEVALVPGDAREKDAAAEQEARAAGDVLDAAGGLRRARTEEAPLAVAVVTRGRKTPTGALSFLATSQEHDALAARAANHSALGSAPAGANSIGDGGSDGSLSVSTGGRLDAPRTGMVAESAASLGNNGRSGSQAQSRQTPAQSARTQPQTADADSPAGALEPPPAPMANSRTAKRPWPTGNFSPEMQLYRAQMGWQAFAKWVHEDAVGPAPPGTDGQPIPEE